MFHSLISPSLNIGLILPDYVIEKALETNNVPLNSLEGFIRQIIGWREYMRAIYLIKGKEIGKGNYWSNQKPLPNAYYKASTGVLPLDKTLERVNRTAYAHHIERLMIIGNFSLLLGIEPNEIYRWFMEMFIDSYEWVMKPNIYCMSQYSEGGLITTKPYISSSNYIRKMSDYPRENWVEKWDSLFWAFINKHKEKIKENPRTRVILYNLNRKTDKKMKQYNAIAKETIENIL